MKEAVLDRLKLFESEKAFDEFCFSVKHGNQHVLNARQRAFIDTVSATASSRTLTIAALSEVYRAQRGCTFKQSPSVQGKSDCSWMAVPFDTERMLPLPQFVRGGRANTVQRPVLYCSGDRDTAVAETRPWIGSWISVAKMRTKRELNIIDCAATEMEWGLIGQQLASAIDKNLVMVWWAIDQAFSTPVTLDDDQLEYLPTQILCELFRELGFDGIAFKSSVAQGVNYAFFDTASTEIVSRDVVSIEKIKYRINEIPF